jgi:hypothetical protein
LKRSWCTTCQIHTDSDLDRCSVCGTNRALPTGEQCTCTTRSRNGQWMRVLNERCAVHGKRPRLRSVP